MMTEKTTKEIVYRKDAKIFQEMLIDIARNVADKITSHKSESCKAIPSQTKQDIKQAFIQNIEIRLQNLMTAEKIQEKFDILNKLTLEADAEPAWRPTTGQIPITTLKGKYLEEKKVQLTDKLTELRKERIELQREIVQRRKILEKQVKQIEKCRNTQIANTQKTNADLLKPLDSFK